MTELVERLRDESMALRRASWSRPEGGQDGCIAASLADEAADEIERLRAYEVMARSDGEVEQIISAWAFAHNIDGAVRNELFARLRAASPVVRNPIYTANPSRLLTGTGGSGHEG